MHHVLEYHAFFPLDVKNRLFFHAVNRVVLCKAMEPKTCTQVSKEHYAFMSMTKPVPFKMLELLLKYEGESNGSLKFLIKNRNFVPLSCKLVSVLQRSVQNGL